MTILNRPKTSSKKDPVTTSDNASTIEDDHLAWTATSRPVVYGTQGVISSGHYLTSMAGMRMMLSGGNAFDALVAAGFAAAVVEPIASYSLGAEGVFMLYHAKSGDLLSLSGQGTAPNRATVEWYRSQGQDQITTGPGPLAHLSFTVPGVVAALLSLLERYGTKTVGEVLNAFDPLRPAWHPQLRIHARTHRQRKHPEPVGAVSARRHRRVLRQRRSS